jgi:hypothetical protein
MVRFHDRHTGWHFVVNEHGNVKVTRPKHRCNVTQVHPDLIPSRIGLLGLTLECTSGCTLPHVEVADGHTSSERQSTGRTGSQAHQVQDLC